MSIGVQMSDAALVASLNARDSRRALKSGLDIEDRFRSMRLAAHELSITRREARIEMRVSGVEGALALLKHLFEPERLQFFLDRACLAVISPKAVGAMILGHCISMQLMFRSCDLSDAVSRVVLLYIRFTFNGLMSSSLRYANYRQERAMLELQGGEASFRQRGMLLGKFFWVKNGKTVVSIGFDMPTGDQQAHTEANAARLECLEDSLQQYYQGRGLKTTTPRSQQPQNVERPVELPVFSQSVRKRLIRQKYREGSVKLLSH